MYVVFLGCFRALFLYLLHHTNVADPDVGVVKGDRIIVIDDLLATSGFVSFFLFFFS